MHRHRRIPVLAFAAALFLLVAACGGDDSSAEVVDQGSTTAAGDGEPIAGSDDSTTSTDAGSSTTEAGGGEPIAGSNDDVDADEDVDGDGWNLSASSYRGEDGRRLRFECPAGGELGSVWGTDSYTDDSSVCTAAVHAGLIDQETGGAVVIEIGPGEDSYEGSEANGATSRDYGTWGGSFIFPKG